jgi:hypothetical protein
MRVHSAAEDGTTEPICSGLASQRRKNNPGLSSEELMRPFTDFLSAADEPVKAAIIL